MMTLTVVMNKNKDSFLMCKHKKNEIINFIGGKVEDGESPSDASYRELLEETGMTRSDIELSFLRFDSTSTWNGGVWSLYVTAGVLTEDVKLKGEKNELFWFPLACVQDLYSAGFNGDAVVYAQAAMDMLLRE